MKGNGGLMDRWRVRRLESFRRNRLLSKDEYNWLIDYYRRRLEEKNA